MTEFLALAASGGAGLALGGFYFGGLWWTVKRGLASPAPALWFIGSMILRTALVLAGFRLVGGNHGGRLLLCLAGFILARLLLTYLTRSSANPGPSPRLVLALPGHGAGRSEGLRRMRRKRARVASGRSLLRQAPYAP